MVDKKIGKIFQITGFNNSTNKYRTAGIMGLIFRVNFIIPVVKLVIN
jgi:hypothetical protein